MTSQKFPLIPELSKDIFTRKEILSEEKKETKKICVLSNCPHSHSSSHEQWQELAWFMNHPTTPENTSFLILFSTTVFSDSLQLHVLWHTRLPCPSNCPEFLQIYVHWVNDVMQPSHPVLFHSPPALNFSQHQGLHQWFGSWPQVAKVLAIWVPSVHSWTVRGDFPQDCLV